MFINISIDLAFSGCFPVQMALMKHRVLFELLEKHGRMLLDTKLQSTSQATHIAITTMLEELAPNLWEDDLNRLVDFGHLISPALEMVTRGRF